MKKRKSCGSRGACDTKCFKNNLIKFLSDIFLVKNKNYTHYHPLVQKQENGKMKWLHFLFYILISVINRQKSSHLSVSGLSQPAQNIYCCHSCCHHSIMCCIEVLCCTLCTGAKKKNLPMTGRKFECLCVYHTASSVISHSPMPDGIHKHPAAPQRSPRILLFHVHHCPARNPCTDVRLHMYKRHIGTHTDILEDKHYVCRYVCI